MRIGSGTVFASFASFASCAALAAGALTACDLERTGLASGHAAAGETGAGGEVPGRGASAGSGASDASGGAGAGAANGAAGAPASGGAATAGAGGVGAGGRVLDVRVSLFCGDGVVDPITEECDDGGDLEVGDLCSPTCQVHDALPQLQAASAWDRLQSDGPSDELLDGQLGRFLGLGRHPIGAGPAGFAVAFVQEPQTFAAAPFIGLALYDYPVPIELDAPRLERDPWEPAPSEGQSWLPVVNVSVDTRVPLFADPVVAGLADGSFAVAFTDHAGDGDSLGIAVRRVHPADPFAGELRHANATGDYSQYDADIVALDGGTSVVVAWTDDRDAQNGPDLYLRRLNTALTGPAEDTVLAATPQAEGHVALTEFAGDWAAAWRASAPASVSTASGAGGAGGASGVGAAPGAAGALGAGGASDAPSGDPGSVLMTTGRETLEVELADGTHWTVLEPLDEVSFELGPFLPGHADDRPALVALTEQHLLVLFTVGTDPAGTGLATVGRLRGALLDVEAPGTVMAQFVPEAMDAAPEIAQSHPAAAVVAGGAPDWQEDGTGPAEPRLYLSWRSESQGDPAGDELHLKEAAVRPAVAGDEHVFELDGATYALDFAPARPLPRWDAGLAADQRSPALAAAPFQRTGALLAAWTDFGQEHDALQAQPDVVVQMAPLPLDRDQDRTDECGPAPEEQCGGGEGHCEGTEECRNGLVCETGLGPNFGLGNQIALCVPLHCTDGVQNEGESDIDCGGSCGRCVGCGNGVLEWPFGEVCDDGNRVTGDGCRADCLSVEICGDRIVDPEIGEACDDGNTVDGDGCSADCSSDETCGNGTVDPGEVCDDGNRMSGDGCRADCQSAEVCGDGITDWQAGELCDDGNDDPLDGCVDCLLPGCGDGHVQPPEQCDDGWASDTCTSLCTISSCGDGIVNPVAGEQCDPVLDPECDPVTCQLPSACIDPSSCLYAMTSSDSSPTDGNAAVRLQIGNGSSEPVSLAGLTARYWFTKECASCAYAADCHWAQLNCANVSRAITDVTPAHPTANAYLEVSFGSNVVLQPGATTGTTDLGLHDAGWSTMDETNDYSHFLATSLTVNQNVTLYVNGDLVWGIEPGGSFTLCGDGVVGPGEACDDAGYSPTCDPDCTAVACPDGTLNRAAGEICDDGAASPTCTDQCTPSFCGDGIVNPAAGEVCDVALSPTCRQPNCDGFEPGLGCANGDVCVKVQNVVEDVPTDVDVKPNLLIVNNGPVSVPLDELTVRYWFTHDSDPNWPTLLDDCFYTSAPGGCAVVATSVQPLAPELSGANAVYEVAFATSAELSPGGATEVKLRLRKESWPPFDEADDYSYQSTPQYADNVRITLYRNGELLWGYEPGPTLYCGDGSVEPPEVCDDGGNSPNCDWDCTPAVCGDGVTNPAAGEICDDGNTRDEAACPGGGPECLTCSSDCQTEVWLSNQDACGDGQVSGTEICDDGNDIDETTCDYGTPSCTLCSSDCSTPLDLVGPYCGDAVTTDAEACDDGNTTSEIECDYGTPSCTRCAADCATVLDLTGAYCGDGTVDWSQGEMCDPGLEPNCLPDCSDYEQACVDPSSCLYVQHRRGDSSSSNESVQPVFRLVNPTNETIPLDELTVRYWFTAEPVYNSYAWECTQLGTDLLTECYWAELADYTGVSACNTSAFAVAAHDTSPPRSGASQYVELTFPSTAATLGPGARTGDLHVRARKCDWSNFNESDDYSYSSRTSFGTATDITLYRNGVLIWGMEP